MRLTPTLTTSTEEIVCSFTTIHLGNKINLKITTDQNLFSVFQDTKLIGHLKMRDSRNIWVVVNSNYISSYLINKIEDQINATLLRRGFHW
jgi:hypothetical protein